MAAIRVVLFEKIGLANPDRGQAYADMEPSAGYTAEVTPPAIHAQALTHLSP